MNRYSLLRAGLWTNAAICAGLAFLSLIASAPLAHWTGIPRGALIAAGVALLGVAALAAFVARREPMNVTLAKVILWGDDAYVLGTVLLLAVVRPPLTGAGQAVVAAAGVATAIVALLEWAGLRRVTMGGPSRAAAVR